MGEPGCYSLAHKLTPDSLNAKYTKESKERSTDEKIFVFNDDHKEEIKLEEQIVVKEEEDCTEQLASAMENNKGSEAFITPEVYVKKEKPETFVEDIEMNREMANAEELVLESEPLTDPLAVSNESSPPQSSKLATAAQKKHRQQNPLALRSEIVALRSHGLSIRKIANQLSLSSPTVIKWIKRYEGGGTLTDLKRKPRPRLTTNQIDEKIRQAVEENPFTNAHAIRDRLQLDFWSRVVFTDEKKFTSTNLGKIQICRTNNTRYKRRSIDEEQSGQVTIKDHCPMHTARVVRKWFKTRKDLQLMDWPTIGYDINPIDNIWRNIVHCWDPERKQSEEELLAHIRTQWELFRSIPKVIGDHVSSIPDRLQSVIENDGDSTQESRLILDSS
ncbi:hypothetical protein Pmani_017742 [Petrolisthes manimaculis]|uniref:Paired domain-containing protein n=1 Tax=Petrolisthes manimaculis TaxID=1843537 RepID=A0AAE1U554_9EUCA|nr:hypothetical protein Pmani_017742 [Petrolisthes manimaculis]